jgi:hypothetical protein
MLTTGAGLIAVIPDKTVLFNYTGSPVVLPTCVIMLFIILLFDSIRPVFLAIHQLQHLPEWARCVILPLPSPCPPLVRGLHSKIRWLAQLCQAGGLVVQFTHQVGKLYHQSTYRIRCS